MCGRTAMNWSEQEVQAVLQRAACRVSRVRNEPTWRRTYNVAPGSNQPVYRASTTKGHLHTGDSDEGEMIVQTMRWGSLMTGLIPSWMKRAPDYSTMLKTINCRDDSLYENKGMWNGIKGKKRCVVPVLGYYEWLKKSPKEKIPHFTKRTDGNVVLLAGLWDSVQYEGEDTRIFTYTIITTNATQKLAFLHDRMPVILEPDSDELRRWLDPNEPWSESLGKILQPFQGNLECYPVNKDVGKVGNNSPNFVIPIDSVKNKSNIANFFRKEEEPPKKKQKKASP